VLRGFAKRTIIRIVRAGLEGGSACVTEAKAIARTLLESL
jgi:hypothetical protein